MAIRLAGTLEPANGRSPVAYAKDIELPDGTRLPDNLPVYLTQAEYDALVADKKIDANTLYMIVEDDGG